jgi:salicylate 1-O-methyltransferase
VTTTSGMEADYDVHSEYQRRVVVGGDRLIRDLVSALEDPSAAEAVAIADYGAGTGATSVHAMRVAIEAVRRRAPAVPVLAVHNDLVTSDFTQLFHNVGRDGGYLGLPGGPVYATAAAGSFFDQVVPAASVDAGICSNASHWLRDQPAVTVPKGMYFANATGEARRRLADQAAEDWRAFLAARAAELRPHGRLLVQGIGRSDQVVSASRLVAVMWQVALGLVEDGMLDRATLDDYVVPVYCRSAAEVSATVPGLAVATLTEEEVDNPYWEQYERDGDAGAYAKTYIAFVRAFAASSLTSGLLGGSAALCDEFFARLQAATEADPAAGRFEAWIVRVTFERTAGAVDSGQPRR